MAEQITEQGSRHIEDLRGSSIYSATGPYPPAGALVRTAGELGHPEARHTARRRGELVETLALFAGRQIFGGFFVYSGINHFRQRQSMVAYAKRKGVPAPEAAVVGSGLLALAGGLSILTGAFPKIGAGLISTFLLGVSPKMHAFWRESDPQQRMHEMVNFTKNMSLVGASLMAMGRPEPWPWSVPIAMGKIRG